MKKWLAILVTLTLLLCGVAVAETQVEDDSNINIMIEEGSFIIQIPVTDGDLAWIADDMASDNSVVTLYDADVLEDTFVARYDAVGDGDVTVAVRHFIGIACDEMYTFDLHVEQGAVQECTGGEHLGGIDTHFDAIDAGLIGQWLGEDAQSSVMTIEKNPSGVTWDVEIVTPASHGAYVFKGTVQYDCELNSFVYDKGIFLETEITESDEAAAESEPVVVGASGAFLPGRTEDNQVTLTWHNEESPEEDIIFARADAVTETAETTAGKVIEPMFESLGDDVIPDGIYDVTFDPASLADGILSFTVYSEDIYDIVDIATLETGDTIVIAGEPVPVETLELDEDDDLMINGIWLLHAFEEDNGWKVVQEDDYPTWTERDDVTLPPAANVVYTDSSVLDQDPVTVTGASEIAAAIASSEDASFSQYNTSIRVENGEVVEINRAYMP